MAGGPGAEPLENFDILDLKVKTPIFAIIENVILGSNFGEGSGKLVILGAKVRVVWLTAN